MSLAHVGDFFISGSLVIRFKESVDDEIAITFLTIMEEIFHDFTSADFVYSGGTLTALLSHSTDIYRIPFMRIIKRIEDAYPCNIARIYY